MVPGNVTQGLAKAPGSTKERNLSLCCGFSVGVWSYLRLLLGSELSCTFLPLSYTCSSSVARAKPGSQGRGGGGARTRPTWGNTQYVHIKIFDSSPKTPSVHTLVIVLTSFVNL